MVKPIDPSKPTGGNGQEKYPAKPKHGPGKFDESLEKAKSDRLVEKEQVRKMGDALDKAGVPLPKPDTFPKTTAAFEAIAKSDAERAERKAAKAAAKGGGGAGGDFSGMKGLDKPFKKGGEVSEASHRRALEKAGFYVKGKTKSERKKIVSKVTTKPQRLGMVEKLFSAKRMNSGGMASKRADGCAIKGKTRA
jgi:hypothetical protein